MAIDYDKIMSMKTNDVEYSYTDNDTMLYALGIGFGRDPLNRKELDFVYGMQEYHTSFRRMFKQIMRIIWRK